MAHSAETVYAFSVPIGTPYAELLELYIRQPIVRCPKCGSSISQGPEYIEVEWDKGSDVIGDFVNAGGPVVVRVAIFNEMLQHFSGFVKGEVRMRDHPKLRRPARQTKKMPRRVWLPYQGPELCYIRVTREVALHPMSTVDIESKCEQCGITRYKAFHGLEKWKGSRRIPREPGKGLFFQREWLEGAGVFRPRFTGLTLCTEDVKSFIRTRDYTNIEFLEVGEFVS